MSSMECEHCRRIIAEAHLLMWFWIVFGTKSINDLVIAYLPKNKCTTYTQTYSHIQTEWTSIALKMVAQNSNGSVANHVYSIENALFFTFKQLLKRSLIDERRQPLDTNTQTNQFRQSFFSPFVYSLNTDRFQLQFHVFVCALINDSVIVSNIAVRMCTSNHLFVWSSHSNVDVESK